MNKRGFTLIEAVIAIVVLAIAVPATTAMIRDATVARADSAQTARALWLGNAICEQMLADAASDDPALGMEAFEEQYAYVNAPDTGLRDRLETLLSDYEPFGMDFALSIGPLVAVSGIASGDPERDVYRSVELRILWRSATGDQNSMPLSLIVTDLTP
jgi:prepilin-type N-terminal cleavage/methylation domain-containing protein